MSICEECNLEFKWCKPCNSKYFKNNFYEWSSGNEKIDKFIRDAQLNAYNRFKGIKVIAKGGFGKLEVALKKFDNFTNLNEEFLGEMVIQLKSIDISSSIRIYGITKDPETNKYMMSFNTSDFGLSKIVGQSLENSNNRNVFGVLPYIAPEVLYGEEYTKAVDVYFFGIIAYELITGFAPFYDVPHDKDLVRQICDGLRPKITFHTPKLIARIIMRCWDARATHRPTFEGLTKEFEKYRSDYKLNNFNNNTEIMIQIDNSRTFSRNLTNTTINYNYKTHPQAICTSRLNYSSLPKPKNDENFEKELEEISTSALIASGSNLISLKY
ncbi:hypothetical protein Glove_21g83 [Diversispora epigaea]|uniref:Protein kinase domain-containing protein n=1 Tax=Diversispora epigaea TaxID=1348612 RepID=A0A397JRT2_9GLOM|nr:hypothetical protein Glove_21g83 [Diversispora epigaea]